MSESDPFTVNLESAVATAADPSAVYSGRNGTTCMVPHAAAEGSNRPLSLQRLDG